MERFIPEVIDEMVDVYGSGDALADAKLYIHALTSAVNYTAETLKRLEDHVERMKSCAPLTSTIPYGSGERANLAMYLRRKSGGLVSLRMWVDAFDICIPEKIFETIPDLAGKNIAMKNENANNRQYTFHEEDFVPVAYKHADKLAKPIQRLYFAHDALRRIGERFYKSKDIGRAINEYEESVSIQE